MERVDFLATDGIQLNGFIYKSREKISDKVILAVHGMSTNCFNKRNDSISKKAIEDNIDYFCFNNRGSELVKYIRRNISGKKEKMLAGTTYEDVLEGYEDIIGAILKLKEIGYKNIYLLGHSLGSTKIVYTYNELKQDNDDILNNIKGVILLSLIDIPSTLRIYLRDKLDTYISLAEEKEKTGLKNELMPKDAFIHPISVKSFLKYARDNKEIDFAKYSEENDFKIINNINSPLMMRWGNNNEMILQSADEIVRNVNDKIINNKKDIGYIDGADHGYTDKEEMLAEQVINFIKKYDN